MLRPQTLVIAADPRQFLRFDDSLAWTEVPLDMLYKFSFAAIDLSEYLHAAFAGMHKEKEDLVQQLQRAQRGNPWFPKTADDLHLDLLAALVKFPGVKKHLVRTEFLEMVESLNYINHTLRQYRNKFPRLFLPGDYGITRSLVEYYKELLLILERVAETIFSPIAAEVWAFVMIYDFPVIKTITLRDLGEGIEPSQLATFERTFPEAGSILREYVEISQWVEAYSAQESEEAGPVEGDPVEESR